VKKTITPLEDLPKRIIEWQEIKQPSYESMKPVIFELLDVIECEILRLYISRAYTEWKQSRTK